MYRRVLERGWLVVVLLFAAAAVALGIHLPHVTVDASTNLLLDERDPDLAYYAKSRRMWPSDDEFAIVCCRRADWFTAESLALLHEIDRDLKMVPHQKKVLSLLDIPLLRNGGTLLAPPTIDAPDIDLAKAKEELTQHAVASGTLISTDGRDAVFLVYLAQPEGYGALDRERDEALEAGDDAKVARLDPVYEEKRAELRDVRRKLVAGVRAVKAKWSERLGEKVQISGLPQINLSLIEFVSHDVWVFGISSLLLFVLAFAVIYRRVRWTALPIVACFLPLVLILGALGVLSAHPELLPVALAKKFSGKLTVITANLPLLLFVVMLPFTVYFVERYRERRAHRDGEGHVDSTERAARDVWLPCLYSCTTTMAGFASLLTSGVKPVWAFGFLMTIGLAVGIACVFLFLPAATVPLGALEDPKAEAEPKASGFVRMLERIVLSVPALLVVAGVTLYGLGGWGCAKLTAENKFIDYFKPTSEVYEGLQYIDQHMGGTTPLDIVLTSDKKGFFIRPEGIAAIRAASEHVSTRVAEAGKVTSLPALLDEAHKPGSLYEKFSNQALIANGMSNPNLKSLILDLVSADFTTARILVRFRETAPTLNRKAILDGLRADLGSRPEVAALCPVDDKGNRHPVTGVFLLYSNMLESLIQSQKDTFWAVILAISLMLMTLFGVESHLVKVPVALALSIVPFFLPPLVMDVFGLTVASIAVLSLVLTLTMRLDERLRARGSTALARLMHTLALSLVVHLPQILPAVVVLGVMGWTGVPLDLITVTIAAIAMGVGIDSSIQYTVRYRIELAATGGDRRAAVTRSHATIGRSIWIATSIMVAGFLVMAFSDFVPTVYFGVFNALAMVIGQLATLTVLPALFVLTGLPRR